MTTKRTQLISSISQLSERGLLHSARWAAEQLVGLNKDEQFDQPEDFEQVVIEHPLEPHEYEQYLLAKTYFDLREYRCAAELLSPYASSHPKSIFLRSYSLYLVGEKRKEEQIYEISNGNTASVINNELSSLQQEFSRLYKLDRLDAFCLYLYGLVLKESGHNSHALKIYSESVNRYPFIWSAWEDLASLCDDYQTIEGLGLRDHWVKEHFLAHWELELQHNIEALQRYCALKLTFPSSPYIISKTALAHYNLREFDEAEALLESVLQSNPYRLESMDVYSNILYVKEDRPKLSFLAHTANQTDKYRPETCFIIGNYYSLNGAHEKAVLYFRRALKLDRKYLSAWTLMGHEYVEMKNTAAAVEAYREAVDINPRDYRAWYGLGQTYELLKMPLYAIHYYKKVTQLRPYDARMWCAEGGCYESLGKVEEAIHCYERAEKAGDRDGLALHKLAKLYAERNDHENAAHYYTKNLRLLDSRREESQQMIEALLFLATHCTNIGAYSKAEAYCNRLLDFSGKEKEEAKALLRQIHSARSSAINNNNNNT